MQFDRNRYSVPRACAFRTVTVKGYVDRVEVVDGATVVARHLRSYGRNEQVLDPLHYLATLGRRPAALDHAPVLRDWQLPESFLQLRQRLEKRHGRTAGRGNSSACLQLLAEHPLSACSKRWKRARVRRKPTPSASRRWCSGWPRRMRARRLPGDRHGRNPGAAARPGPVRRLVHGRRRGRWQMTTRVAARQPEATAAADDGCRVRETGA